MSTSVYQINKGINKPIEFKGLKAQYIWYLGGGLIALLILFAVLYICGIHTIVCLITVISLGTYLFMYWKYAPEIESLLLHEPDYFNLAGARYFYY